MEPLEVLAVAGIVVAVPDGIARDGNGCAIWPLGKTAKGYGVCYPFPGGGPRYVHRLVCAAAHRPIPDGWHVDHVWKQGCRSRACFWPDHLEAVTHEENQHRAALAARELGPRSCGHAWDDCRPGRYDCASCHREAEAARYAAKPNRAHERVRLIRHLLAAGGGDAEIAAQVGASRMTVVRVKNGTSYADVR